VLFYSLVVNQHRRRDASLESQQNLMWEEANAKCLIHLVIFTVTSLKSYASLDPKFSISLSYLAGRGTIKQLLISSWNGRPFGHNRHGPKNGVFVPLSGELGPHVTQCGLGGGLPSYQVASWSIQPFVYYCVVCMLRFVTRWGGPGGIEAYP